MARLKSLGIMEKWGLVLAVIFIVLGVYSIVQPREGIVAHPSAGVRQASFGKDPPPEYVTKNGARIYGFISVGLGTGLVWLAFYRPRK